MWWGLHLTSKWWVYSRYLRAPSTALISMRMFVFLFLRTTVMTMKCLWQYSARLVLAGPAAVVSTLLISRWTCLMSTMLWPSVMPVPPLSMVLCGALTAPSHTQYLSSYPAPGIPSLGTCTKPFSLPSLSCTLPPSQTPSPHSIVPSHCIANMWLPVGGPVHYAS